jgi:hypothetical protein
MVTVGIVNKRFEIFYFFSSPTFRAQLTEILSVSAVGVGGQAAIELPATITSRLSDLIFAYLSF